MNNKILYIAAALILALGHGGTAMADLAAIGPVDAATSFPAWVQDANDLQLQPCGIEVAAEGDPGCVGFEAVNPGGGFVAGNIAEFSYYRAETDPGAQTGIFRIRLQVQGADAGGELIPPVAGDPANSVIGNEVLIRWRALPMLGDYTFTTPMGTFTLNANETDCVDTGGGGAGPWNCPDTGFLATLGTAPDFAQTLTGGNMTYMTNGTGGEILGPGNGLFLGDFLTPAPLVQGNHPLPDGAELVFRVTGPPGSDLGGPGNPTAENDQWLVEGLIDNCAANVAPVTDNDVFGALAGGTGTGHLLINDLDPGPAPDPGILNSTIAIASAPANGTATPNADGTVTYTHSGAPGLDSFTYTVRDACFVSFTTDPGNSLSNASTATVIVEDMDMKGILRPKTMNWNISGNSSSNGFAEPGAQAGQTMLHTALLGAQEVPPVMSGGMGTFTMTLDETAQTIDYTLNLSGTFSSAVTQAHIHTGAAGTNGPVNFFICADAGLNPPAGTPVCPQPGGSLSGTLGAADFIAAGGVDTFAAAAAGMLAGEAYVNIHSEANAAGELRGQLGANIISLYSSADGTGPVIGTVMVQADGSWSFSGKSMATPGNDRMISGMSSNGVLLPNQELQIR